jgi:L-threonylcarbamoyladenylate synthase
VGALVQREQAVQRLYTIKGRSADKAIAVLVARSDDLTSIAAQLMPSAQKLALLFWPGSLTLVVPRHPNLPTAVSSLPTVGVRMPDHEWLRRLLEETGPLAVTSANRSGEPNPLNSRDVMEQLGGHIELIIDGGTVSGGVPSTVVDCTGASPLVLREGPVTRAAIEAALST